MIHPEIQRDDAEVWEVCPRCSGDCGDCDVCDGNGTVPQSLANEARDAGKVDKREFMPRFPTTHRPTRRN